MKTAPFTLLDARNAGLTRYHLRASAWRRIGPATYAWAGLPLDPWLTIVAAAHRLPGSGAFSGLTAAWLHGLDVEPCDPIEVTVPHAGGVAARTGLAVSRAYLDADDVVLRRGLRVTTVARTIFDLSRRRSLTESLVVADSALHRGLIDLAALQVVLGRARGRPGVKRLRRVVDDAEPRSESPMETRLRLLLVDHGLPRPAAQVDLHDVSGRFVGRADLYYPTARLAIEYDGDNHRERLAEDDRRQNRLLGAGFQLLRFTSSDLRRSPELVVAQVRAALNGPSTGRRAPNSPG